MWEGGGSQLGYKRRYGCERVVVDKSLPTYIHLETSLLPPSFCPSSVPRCDRSVLRSIDEALFASNSPFRPLVPFIHKRFVYAHSILISIRVYHFCATQLWGCVPYLLPTDRSDRDGILVLNEEWRRKSEKENQSFLARIYYLTIRKRKMREKKKEKKEKRFTAWRRQW